MAEILQFRIPQNKRFRLNYEAAAKVGAYVSLRPAPTESPAEFVGRIVEQYHREADAMLTNVTPMVRL